MDTIRDLASRKAAVIFTKSSCHMCYSIQQLFYELGASPEVHELDKEGTIGREMENALKRSGCNPSLPAVFIGRKYVGSAKDEFLCTLVDHLSKCSLMLKQYGFSTIIDLIMSSAM